MKKKPVYTEPKSYFSEEALKVFGLDEKGQNDKKEVVYSEPKDYIPKDIRKKYHVGEYYEDEHKRIRNKVEVPEELLQILKELEDRLNALYPKQSGICANVCSNVDLSEEEKQDLDESLNKKTSITFRDLLFKHIDSKGLTDSYIYKKAKVDRKLFSKIRSEDCKHVLPHTAIRLALALELTLEETNELLIANHTCFYDDSYFDIVIKWCIEHKIYDVDRVDDILYSCDVNESLFDKY